MVDGAFWTVGDGRNGVQQPSDDLPASMAIAVPKGSGFPMVSDYRRAVNQLIPEQASMPMPQLEVLGMLLAGAAAFCTTDRIQGRW